MRLHLFRNLFLGTLVFSAGSVVHAESINTRLHGRSVASFKKHKPNVANEKLGFALMMPMHWVGKVTTAPASPVSAKFVCNNETLFTVFRVSALEYKALLNKPDFMGEQLAAKKGWVWYAMSTEWEVVEPGQPPEQTACQEIADEISLVTQSFMLIEKGKLVDPGMFR